MTRINCVPVRELSRKHLVAEYRELPRIAKLAYDAAGRGEKPDDPRNPKHYTLGKGHVRFFYNKQVWLQKRYSQLVIEMQRRGYEPNFLSYPYYAMPITWCRSWRPRPQDLELNRQRIQEKNDVAKARRAAKQPRAGRVSTRSAKGRTDEHRVSL